MNNKEDFEDLIYKFYNKELTSEEKVTFEAILKSSDEARKIFHNYNILHQASEIYAIQNNIKSPIPTARKNKLKTYINWGRNIAAVLFIPLLLSVVFLNKSNKEVIEKQYTSISSTNAKVISVTLPDSSIVHVYSSSTLKYANDFNTHGRFIYLDGEATFEVKSDPQNPFYVETIDGSRIKAYGTKFSVCDYKDENTVSVFLERGSVDFENANLEASIAIKSQTQLVFDKLNKQYTIQEVNAREYDAYEKGILLFENQTLDELVHKLKKIYRVEIEINDESIRKYRFTATFKDESLYQILNMLAISSPEMEWNKKGNKIILSKKR